MSYSIPHDVFLLLEAVQSFLFQRPLLLTPNSQCYRLSDLSIFSSGTREIIALYKTALSLIRQ
jgi:hypothetical protein